MAEGMKLLTSPTQVHSVSRLFGRLSFPVMRQVVATLILPERTSHCREGRDGPIQESLPWVICC